MELAVGENMYSDVDIEHIRHFIVEDHSRHTQEHISSELQTIAAVAALCKSPNQHSVLRKVLAPPFTKNVMHKFMGHDVLHSKPDLENVLTVVLTTFKMLGISDLLQEIKAFLSGSALLPETQPLLAILNALSVTDLVRTAHMLSVTQCMHSRVHFVDAD